MIFHLTSSTHCSLELSKNQKNEYGLSNIVGDLVVVFRLWSKRGELGVLSSKSLHQK